MKNQKPILERYFLFACFVIAVHLGLVIWILHTPLEVLNSDSQAVIEISMRGSEPHSKIQANNQAATHVKISKLVTNNESSPVIGSTQVKSTAQKTADGGLSSRHVPRGLAGRNLFFNPKPPYPLASRRMREQGAVHLKLCIGFHGFVEGVRLMQSSGYQNLDRSAIETVKAWRFSALDESSENLSECYQLPIHFQLES